MTPPAHRATTAHLGAAYPFVAERPLRCAAPYIGRDLFGGSFCFDPFELYSAGVVTDPNMVVIGQIGRGKSALVKTYLWRHALLGARAVVIDPKGEYGPLAALWGTRPLRLAPGGGVRLNPLDDPAGARREVEVTRRRSVLVAALAESSLSRTLRPPERAAVDAAVCLAEQRSEGHPLLTGVVDALMSPDEAAARALGTDAAGLAADGRDVALEMRRLVSGDLRGMFDGPTSAAVRRTSGLLVLDLSAAYGSPALGLIMACATAWVQATLAAGAAGPRLLVVDEAWSLLSDLATARWLQASWKLARAVGVSNVAVLHRLSDLHAAGASGTQQPLLAEGLLADSQTRVVYSQPPGEAEDCRGPLGLTGTEVSLLPRLRRGVALWKVGGRSFVVEHRMSALEREMADTDARMTS